LEIKLQQKLCLSWLPVIIEVIFIMLRIVQVNPILLSLPAAVRIATILNQKIVINPKHIEATMSAHPPHVAEVECGAEIVDPKVPLELSTDRDQLEAKIIVFGLAMGLQRLILEPIHDVNGELVHG
jgi:hypothetical protein